MSATVSPDELPSRRKGRPRRRRRRLTGVSRQRRAANARERSRIQGVNSAFIDLKRHLPLETPADVSKTEILRLAARWIAHLAAVVMEHDRRGPEGGKMVLGGRSGTEGATRSDAIQAIEMDGFDLILRQEFSSMTAETSLCDNASTIMLTNCEDIIDTDVMFSDDHVNKDHSRYTPVSTKHSICSDTVIPSERYISYHFNVQTDPCREESQAIMMWDCNNNATASQPPGLNKGAPHLNASDVLSAFHSMYADDPRSRLVPHTLPHTPGQRHHSKYPDAVSGSSDWFEENTGLYTSTESSLGTWPLDGYHLTDISHSVVRTRIHSSALA